MKSKQIDTPADDPVFTYFNEINIIAQLSSKMFQRVLPEHLTLSQFTVLNWFARVDTIGSPGRLASALQVTKGAMSNTLNKLEKKGLVTVSINPDSARSKLVTMTEEGVKVRDQAIASAVPLFRQIAGVFETRSLDRQIKDLQRVREYLDEMRNG